MSHFTEIMPSDAPTSGAVSDVLFRNALAAAGTGALAGTGACAVTACVIAAPGSFIPMIGLGAGAIYAGNRMADGKSINPFAKDDDKAVEPAPAV